MMKRIWEKNIWPELEPMVPDLPKHPIFEELRRQALKNPEKAAIIFYGYEVTYSQLDELSDRFAAALSGMGLVKGDRIGIYLENCPQFVIAIYGVLKMGGVVVTCSPMYKTQELEHELRDAGVKAILLEDPLYPVLASVAKDAVPRNVIVTSFADFLPAKPAIPLHETMSPEKKLIKGTIDFMELLEKTEAGPLDIAIDMENDLALLQYTAGTTGLPKGAMLTHQNLAVHGLLVRHYYEYAEDDIHLVMLPIFHVTGLDIAVNPALAMGSTLVMFARFDLLPMLNAIKTYGVTHWVTITPVNVAVINVPNISDYDFGSLRLVLSGGAPVPVDIHKKWYATTGTHIIEGYGLSECTGGICGNNRQQFSPGTVGAPVYYHDIKLVDVDTGQEAGKGGHGELWIKGPCVMKGYWKSPEQTRTVLTEDGWLKTGDIASVDDEGWLRIVGRSKEMIKVSGYSVFLAEIDAILSKHPAVAEAATIGIPHPYRGEEPKSFVVLKSDYKEKTTEDEVLQFCKENMAAFKCPRQIVFLDSLPKSGAGKILRRVLAEQELMTPCVN